MLVAVAVAAAMLVVLVMVLVLVLVLGRCHCCRNVHGQCRRTWAAVQVVVQQQHPNTSKGWKCAAKKMM